MDAEVAKVEPIPAEHAVHSFVRREVGDNLWTTTEFPETLFQKGYVVGGTARSLMRLGVALACMDVLSQDIAKAPIQLRRYLKNRRGSEIVGPGEHPIARLLDRRPSRYFGWNEFIRIMVMFLATSSEYFVAARRTTTGEITQLAGLDRGKVMPLVVPASGRYFFDIQTGSQHDEAQFGWARGRQSDRDVAHIRTRSLNGFDMIGTEKIAATAFELLSKMTSYQMNIYRSGGMGPMAFLFPDAMTDDQFQRLKGDLAYSREKAIAEGKPFILEGNGKENGMPKVVPLGLSSVEADFVKANEAAAIDVCRAFRVPPHKVFLLNSVKYDNQETQERQYVEASLVPIARAIAECLEPVLLTDAEREDFCLSFDMDALSSLDPKTRQEIWEKRWKAGMCEYDEMREGIGLNAMGGDEGRVRMVSGNFMLIDQNNEVVLAAGGNKPGEEKPPGEEGENAPQGEKSANVIPLRA